MSRKTKPPSKASQTIRRAQKSARRAARGGRPDDADVSARAALRLAAQSRRLESAAGLGAVTPTRTGPVLLDPKGFSPSGIPNRFLNMERLRRAGLPLDTPYKPCK